MLGLFSHLELGTSIQVVQQRLQLCELSPEWQRLQVIQLLPCDWQQVLKLLQIIIFLLNTAKSLVRLEEVGIR